MGMRNAMAFTENKQCGCLYAVGMLPECLTLAMPQTAALMLLLVLSGTAGWARTTDLRFHRPAL